MRLRFEIDAWIGASPALLEGLEGSGGKAADSSQCREVLDGAATERTLARRLARQRALVERDAHRDACPSTRNSIDVQLPCQDRDALSHADEAQAGMRVPGIEADARIDDPQ